MRLYGRSLLIKAPEIIRGEPADQGVDIWALGVLLYEMVHGHSIFADTPTTQERLSRVGLGEKPFVRDGVSVELKNLLEGLLNSDNKRRLTITQLFNEPWMRQNAKRYSMNVDTYLKSNQELLQPNYSVSEDSFNRIRAKSAHVQKQISPEMQNHNGRTTNSPYGNLLERHTLGETSVRKTTPQPLVVVQTAADNSFKLDDLEIDDGRPSFFLPHKIRNQGPSRQATFGRCINSNGAQKIITPQPITKPTIWDDFVGLFDGLGCFSRRT